MARLVGFSDAAAGLVGYGSKITISGGTTVPIVGSWHRPAGTLVPIAGRDGTSIEIRDSVATYADLPDGLGLEDRGALYIVQADDLGYVWNGTAWPADGQGVRIRGPKGERGRSISTVKAEGDGFAIGFSDGTSGHVSIPAVQVALDAADAAATSASAAAGSESAAAGSATAASGSATAAGDSATAAAGSASDASSSATAAAASATGAAGSAADADADATATAADRVQTGQDATATAADRIATGEDRDATAADRTQTGQDRDAAATSASAAAGSASSASDDATATAADRIATGSDAESASTSATAAAADAAQTDLDRAATGQDATDTAADAAQASQDAQATAADRVATGQDATATAADRVQTGKDRAAAATSATNAHDSADAAAQSAADAAQGAPAGGWSKSDLDAGVQSSLSRADTASQPGHDHMISDVTGLQGALDGKSPVGHQHTTADVTGLQAAIDDAVAALVNGAPGALDTLAELAAALGNDPDFASTVMQEIGTKADTTYVDGQLAGKADTVHTHTASDITDATATGRGVLTGTAAAARNSIGVPSTGEIEGLVAQYRPAGIMHSGTGPPPTSIPDAKVGDWYIDTTSMELYVIEAV